MKIVLVGEFLDECRELLERVAQKRGHQIVRPSERAAIAFVMAYPFQLGLAQNAHRRAGFVVALAPGIPGQDLIRDFFKKWSFDVVSFPYSECAAEELFRQLEQEMQEIFG